MNAVTLLEQTILKTKPCSNQKALSDFGAKELRNSPPLETCKIPRADWSHVQCTCEFAHVHQMLIFTSFTVVLPRLFVSTWIKPASAFTQTLTLTHSWILSCKSQELEVPNHAWQCQLPDGTGLVTVLYVFFLQDMGCLPTLLIVS